MKMTDDDEIFNRAAQVVNKPSFRRCITSALEKVCIWRRYELDAVERSLRGRSKWSITFAMCLC